MAEAPDVREEIEVIERDVVRLHPAHRKAGHCPVITIRDRPEGLVDERIQRVGDVGLERRHHPAQEKRGRGRCTPRTMDDPAAFLSATLWTLRNDEHVVVAELWTVRGLGMDLCYLWNGEVRENQLFRGVGAGTRAVDAALIKKAQLQAKGWRP